MCGIEEPFYCRVQDMETIGCIQSDPTLRKRCEFIAPLDCLLWDRKLIRALFDFDYKWEIYTPANQRKYGNYVLPVLYGDRFIGRIEFAREKAVAVSIKNLWYEEGLRPTKTLSAAIDMRAAQFAHFNCGTTAGV